MEFLKKYHTRYFLSELSVLLYYLKSDIQSDFALLF